MRRPHSSSFVRTFETPSHARCTPPSCATESSPYSTNTRSKSCSARAMPTSRAGAPSAAARSANSSRNSRRSDFGERE